MKRGMIIQVNVHAQKPARQMRWTEQMTGTRVTSQPERFYHQSDTIIRTFAAVETCLFPFKHSSAGHIYEITVPADTVIYEYDEEARIELTPACIVRYLGQKVRRYGKDWRPGQSPKIIDRTID